MKPFDLLVFYKIIRNSYFLGFSQKVEVAWNFKTKNRNIL